MKDLKDTTIAILNEYLKKDIDMEAIIEILNKDREEARIGYVRVDDVNEIIYMFFYNNKIPFSLMEKLTNEIKSLSQSNSGDAFSIKAFKQSLEYSNSDKDLGNLSDTSGDTKLSSTTLDASMSQSGKQGTDINKTPKHIHSRVTQDDKGQNGCIEK